MDQERLGDCLAVFEVKRGVLIGGILCAVFGCGLGVFLMAGAVIVPVHPRANPLVLLGLSLTMGAILLLGSAYLLFHSIGHFGLRVSLHPGGLVVLRGDRTSILPWDEIEAVWHKEKGVNSGFGDYLGSVLDGSQSVYTIQGTDGERIVLNSLLRGQEILGGAIRRETTRRFLPQAIRTYEVEGQVEFGKLAISREGLSKGGKMLPWSEVGCVVLQNGFVLVRRRSGRPAWIGVRMGKVPNLYVYLALVERLLEAAASRGCDSPTSTRRV
jgi:hypothetical protein